MAGMVAATGKTILKILGLVLVALGGALLILDIFAFLGGVAGTALGKVWFDTHTYSLNFLQAIIQRYVWVDLWQGGIVPILQMPAWLGLLVTGLPLVIAGLVLFRLGRRHRTRA